MQFTLLPLLLLAACSTHTARDGAPSDDTTLSITAVSDATDNAPRARIWLAIDRSTGNWQGGQTGGGSDVFITTRGDYNAVAGAQLITLRDGKGKNVGQLRGITLASPPKATGTGYSYEKPRSFTWTVN